MRRLVQRLGDWFRPAPQVFRTHLDAGFFPAHTDARGWWMRWDGWLTFRPHREYPDAR